MANPFIQCHLPVQQDERIIKPLKDVCKQCGSSETFKKVKLKWDARTQQLVVYEVTDLTWCSECDVNFRTPQNPLLQCYLQIKADKRLVTGLQEACTKCGANELYRTASLKWDPKISHQLVVFDACHIVWCGSCPTGK